MLGANQESCPQGLTKPSYDLILWGLSRALGRSGIYQNQKQLFLASVVFENVQHVLFLFGLLPPFPFEMRFLYFPINRVQCLASPFVYLTVETTAEGLQ